MSLLIKNGYLIGGKNDGIYDIVVEKNRIARIDKSIEGDFDEVIDADNCLVMPTFCNAHTHLAMSLFRGLADDLSLIEWLTKHIFPAEAEFVNKEMVYICSKFSMLELIASGGGCFSDMYFFEEEVAKAALEVGIRGVIAEGIVDFPSPSCKNADEAIAKTKSLKREFKNEGLIKVAYAPHSTYTLSFESLKKIALEIDEDDIIHIHLNESDGEIQQVLSEKKKRPLDVLEEVGLLLPNTFLAHSVKTTKEEIKRIKAAKAKIIYVPQSNFKLSSGIAPVCDFLKSGVEVYLGTDGQASNNNLDMVEEMRFASLVQKVKYDEKSLNAKTAFSIATESLFERDRLVEGALADIAIVSLDSFEAVPMYNPYSFVVYAMNSRSIRDVIIDGEIVYRNREFVKIDANEVAFEVKKLAKKVADL